MNSNGILHLTVNASGRIRIWESPADAMAGKDATEVVVQLPLTKSQMALVIRAEGLSRQKTNERIPHSGYISPSTDGY